MLVLKTAVAAAVSVLAREQLSCIKYFNKKRKKIKEKIRGKCNQQAAALKRSRQVEIDLFEAAIYVLTLSKLAQAFSSCFVKSKSHYVLGACCGVACRNVAWRGMA